MAVLAAKVSGCRASGHPATGRAAWRLAQRREQGGEGLLLRCLDWGPGAERLEYVVNATVEEGPGGTVDRLEGRRLNRSCQTKTPARITVKISEVAASPTPSVRLIQPAKLSPTVVQRILMTQNHTVISGTLFNIVGLAAGNRSDFTDLVTTPEAKQRRLKIA